VQFSEPVTDALIEQAKGWDGGRVMVYLLNGKPYRAGDRLRLRVPVKWRGKWCVRDCGRVPLRAARTESGSVSFTT
jgi:hypothetical protein